MRRSCRQPELSELHGTTNHPAPHGWSEEEIFVLNMEVLQTSLLKGGSEVLRLFIDQVFVGIELLGDEGEKAPR